MSDLSHWWNVGGQVLYFITFYLTKAVLAFLQRDSYLYWPFLVSSILLAVLVASFCSSPNHPNRKEPNAYKRFRSYFSSNLWWHRSARADYRLYFANALLFPVLITPFVLNDGKIVALMESMLSANEAMFINANMTTMVAIRIAFTIAFFIAFDFGRFLAHSLLHDIAALWPFHKVHHSAEVLTPITSYRIHPVEMLMMAWVPALMTGIVTWAFNRFAGAGVTFYSFLGLHVLIWVFNLIDNLRHSPVWLSYGLTVGRWLVSPAHHQLHHSVESRHWGCNRGSNLAIWDRLYGTLYVPGLEPETFRLGLGDDSEAKWHSLWTIYVQPFKESLRTIWALARTRSGSQA